MIKLKKRIGFKTFMNIGIEQETKSMIFLRTDPSKILILLVKFLNKLVFNYKIDNMIINSVDSIKNVLFFFINYLSHLILI